MDSTSLARLLSHLVPASVLYAVVLPGSATVYTVQRGVLYLYRATDTGHGYMLPQTSDRAAWARVAAACAFTVPANPQTMRLGAAGASLGAFWRGLPDVAAERGVSAADLLASAQA
jgi:hypothetical protein